MIQKTVEDAINYRRSVRIYDPEKKIDSALVKKCIYQASLAPNSSNMQLWEFYHITSKEAIQKIAPLCFNQNAARTAEELVIFVTRKDLWKKRKNSNLQMIDRIFPPKPKSEQSSREKVSRNYYGKLIPFAYSDFLGIFGFLKYLMILVIGIFKPIFREVRNSDMRIVAHKTCALAAENFMLSMAAEGYDTCPMEGSDTLMVKKILNLSKDSEINMVIGCGLKNEKGVYGPRFRVPFENVYKYI